MSSGRYGGSGYGRGNDYNGGMATGNYGGNGANGYGNFQSNGYGGYGGGGYGGGGNYGNASAAGGNNTFGTGAVAAPRGEPIPFEKNFYRESEKVRNMTPSEIEALRNEHQIRIVSGGRTNCGLNPIPTFEDAGFDSDVVSRLYGAGFKSPSPIQSQAWPILLSGHDMIGIAETGSGKTLAFLLPAMVHISHQPPLRNGDGPITLVLAPTRELVEQIKNEAQKFAGRLRVGVAYGGSPKRTQLYALRAGCEIVAACPGRLIDFVESRCLNLERVTYLVLDEADRMLDMGFEPQIRKIVAQIRPDRQTLMFSATWPREVQGLARDLCKEDPVHVAIGSTDLKASHNVKQYVQVVSDLSKKDVLMSLMHRLQEQDSNQRIIIFTETKFGCDQLANELRRSGFKALEIHGDKEQRQREYVLREFKQGRSPIMVATDVASRGLDVKDVKVVINYDMPNQIEDYVHRIGRTGRAGALGESHSFVTQDKGRLARDLVRIMEEAHQEIPDDLRQLSYSAGGGGGYGPSRYGGRRGGGGSRFGGGGAFGARRGGRGNSSYYR